MARCKKRKFFFSGWLFFFSRRYQSRWFIFKWLSSACKFLNPALQSCNQNIIETRWPIGNFISPLSPRQPCFYSNSVSSVYCNAERKNYEKFRHMKLSRTLISSLHILAKLWVIGFYMRWKEKSTHKLSHYNKFDFWPIYSCILSITV